MTVRAAKTIIVGAGIGGLAAALALLRAGHRVRVIEQSSSLGEVGAGLSITPNASKALAYLGLADELARIGSTPAAGSLRHYRTGEDLVTLPQDRSRERYGYPDYPGFAGARQPVDDGSLHPCGDKHDRRYAEPVRSLDP